MAILNTETLDPATTIEVVKLLAGSEGDRPRLAMRGTSMLPLLHEPMVLVLQAATSRHHVGDLIVFSREGKLVAHRITSLRNGVVETCGDAVPWSPEYPDADSIVGDVAAVLTSDDVEAVRIDTARIFRLRGLLLAYSRSLRAGLVRVREQIRRLALALPWKRPRAYVALVQAMSAAILERQEMLARALAAVQPQRLAAVARRHSCSAMLVDAIVGLKVATAQSKALSSSLQASGRQVVLRGMAARSHLMTVVGHLQSTGLPFALLKGAARLYTDDPDATLNASADFDILVRGADVDAISAALRARGYSYRADLEQQEQYRADHHHAAPLFPPDEGCIIELHYDLAPPGTLSIPLNWEALEAHMVAAQGPCGPVMCLDRIRAALHLIVHSVGMHRLRDSVLLARHMSRLDRRELDELRQTISMERIDPIRLSAAAALAARMARVAWPVSGSVEEYLRWQLRREDVPLYFSQRSQLAEGWYACGRRLGPLAWRLLDPTAGLREREGARPPLLALIGRVATSVAAFAYTSMMRPAG